MLWNLTAFLAITGGCLLALSAPTHAQKEKKVEPTKEEIQRERMENLMTAYDLAAKGRKKNAPEYLITAAGMLRRLSSIKDLQEMKESEVKPEITTDGKAAVEKEAKVITLLEQSDELFKEASDMGASLGVNVDKLIKIAKERERSDKEERSVVGGPKRVVKYIGGGHLHTFKYTLRTGDYTQWMLRSSDTLEVSVVRADNEQPYYWHNTTSAQRVWHPNWHPNPKLKVAHITIRVRNHSGSPIWYEMMIQ
jgi:hypothetical protein